MARTPHLLAAAHLILFKDGQVLLQRRFQTGWMDGQYSLPAGHIENGEPALACLQREIKEELGLRLSPENLRASHVMHRLAENDLEYLDFFFQCMEWQGNPVICEPEKCDDLSWFSLSNLPSNIVPYVKSALQSWQNQLWYSEFGWPKKTAENSL